MQKHTLGEIRDLVTTPATREVVEAIRLQNTFNTKPQNTTFGTGMIIFII